MLGTDHLCIELDDGSQGLFVPWHDVDGGGSPSNLRGVLGRSRSVDELRRWLGGVGQASCDLDDVELVDAAARTLELHGYVFVRLRRPSLAGAGRPSSTRTHERRSTAPLLSELAEKAEAARTGTLSVELVDKGGAPHAGVELTLVHCDGRRDRVVLDDAGRWSGREVPLPGPTRVELPTRLARAKRTGADGFQPMISDIAVARRPTRPASLPKLNEHYRLVVEPARGGFSG